MWTYNVGEGAAAHEVDDLPPPLSAHNIMMPRSERAHRLTAAAAQGSRCKTATHRCKRATHHHHRTTSYLLHACLAISLFSQPATLSSQLSCLAPSTFVIARLHLYICHKITRGVICHKITRGHWNVLCQMSCGIEVQPCTAEWLGDGGAAWRSCFMHLQLRFTHLLLHPPALPYPRPTSLLGCSLVGARPRD